MQIHPREIEDFPKKYNWMLDNLRTAHQSQPSVLEVLAAIMVMEKEQPTKLVELMREIKNEMESK